MLIVIVRNKRYIYRFYYLEMFNNNIDDGFILVFVSKKLLESFLSCECVVKEVEKIIVFLCLRMCKSWK